MALRQFPFDPTVEDEDRFIDLVNARFETTYNKLDNITKKSPVTDTSDYPRNSIIDFKDSNVAPSGRIDWYYDRADIEKVLKNFAFPYIYEEEVHFHNGLPHHADEVIDWMEDEFGLTMSKHEIYTNSKGSGGPFFQYNFVVHPDSYTMTGRKDMWVRNKWKNHFDEYLSIFTLPDINSL